MKTDLIPAPHTADPGRVVVEIWHAGQFIGTITGADGPGVRIISKHSIKAKPAPDDGSRVNVLELAILPE